MEWVAAGLRGEDRELGKRLSVWENIVVVGIILKTAVRFSGPLASVRIY